MNERIRIIVYKGFLRIFFKEIEMSLGHMNKQITEE